jgi:hypothetical protein
VIRLWAVLNCSVRRTGAAARRVGAGFQGPEVLWAGNREQGASGPGFEWNWLSARLFGMGGCPPRTALIVLGGDAVRAEARTLQPPNKATFGTAEAVPCYKANDRLRLLVCHSSRKSLKKQVLRLRPPRRTSLRMTAARMGHPA